MQPISKDLLKLVARRLMFDMNEEEYETLLKEFDIIIKQMELIGKIKDIDGVEPMVFPFPITSNVLREDIPSTSLTQDEALRNATDIVEGQIRLPKVVG